MNSGQTCYWCENPHESVEQVLNIVSDFVCPLKKPHRRTNVHEIIYHIKDLVRDYIRHLEKNEIFPHELECTIPRQNQQDCENTQQVLTHALLEYERLERALQLTAKTIESATRACEAARRRSRLPSLSASHSRRKWLDILYREQNGQCACCGEPGSLVTNERKRGLQLDHCHNKASKWKDNLASWRGLVCQSCNIQIAYYERYLRTSVRPVRNPHFEQYFSSIAKRLAPVYAAYEQRIDSLTPGQRRAFENARYMRLFPHEPAPFK